MKAGRNGLREGWVGGWVWVGENWMQDESESIKKEFGG